MRPRKAAVLNKSNGNNLSMTNEMLSSLGGINKLNFSYLEEMIACCSGEKTGVIKFATGVEFAVEYCQRVRMLYEVCGCTP